jgi:hypothetical protein
VVFLFSKAFHDALETKADNCPRKYGVSAEEAVEEFRRLLAIKTWVVDVDAKKISPTPVSKLHVFLCHLLRTIIDLLYHQVDSSSYACEHKLRDF